MPRFNKIDYEKEDKLQKHFDELEAIENLQKQQRDMQLDQNIVPKVTYQRTADALRSVELQEKLEQTLSKMSKQFGVLRQLHAKLAILLTLAVGIADESHPVFTDISATEQQIKEFSTHEVIVTGGLLSMKPSGEEETDYPEVSDFPREERFEMEEEAACEASSSSDSVISLSALKHTAAEAVYVTTGSFKQNQTYNVENMSKTVEERAREFRAAKREVSDKNLREVDHEELQKMREEQSTQTYQRAQKGMIEVFYRPRRKPEEGIRRPSQAILQNKNALGDTSNHKQISKKNLQRRYNQFEDGRSKLLRANRAKRVEGYFGESQINQGGKTDDL